MKKIIGWLTGIDRNIWLAVGGVALALGVFGWWSHARYEAGVKAGRAQFEAEFKVAYAKALKQQKWAERRADTISADARKDLGVQNAQTHDTFKTLRRKAPHYVTAQDDARCIVNAGFVRMYNEAVSSGGQSKVSRSPGGSDAAASDVQLSDVLNTDLDNLEIGYLIRNEAVTWRKWYADQKAEWDKPR